MSCHNKVCGLSQTATLLDTFATLFIFGTLQVVWLQGTLLADEIYFFGVINPRRARAARVTVLGLCVCVCVCLLLNISLFM